MIDSLIVQITDGRLLAGRSNLRLYTSLEGENPGGSIKDHVVYGELKSLLDDGRLKPGDLVSEISAGSTALSLAYYTRLLGLRLLVFLPDDAPAELLAKIKGQGGETRLVEPKTAFERYKEFVAGGQAWDFNQTFDTSKRRHYAALAERIETHAGSPDALIGAVGTGHSLLGIASVLSTAPALITAEPEPGEKISGIRNIEADSLGSDDPCPASCFDHRAIVHCEDYFSRKKIETAAGDIEFSQSFRLVTGAIEEALKLYPHIQSMFLIGAKNKRA